MAILRQKLKSLFRLFYSSHDADKILIIAIFFIIIFGLITLSSATSVTAFEKYGDAYYFIKRQLVWLVLAITVFWLLAQINYHFWRRYAFAFLIISFILLLMVFIPGIAASNTRARSWIMLFGQQLQPSEFVKLSFLLYLAAWLEVKKENLKNITEGLGTFLAIFGVIAMLMISQPDIGTLSIITLTSFIVYFVGGGKLRHILMIFVIGAVIVFALAQWKPYIQNRFRCLIDPGFDKQKVCYQTNQALIAVGSGGIWGRGLGESRQKYMYIPEIHADSIFAIIAEETGLIISTILILAYLLVFYRGYLIARRAPDDFGRILAIGIVSSIAVQTVVNIGGVINIMPMTGVTLPLISSGGSSMIATMASLGVLVNISKQTKNVKTESVIYKRGKDTRK